MQEKEHQEEEVEAEYARTRGNDVKSFARTPGNLANSRTPAFPSPSASWSMIMVVMLMVMLMLSLTGLIMLMMKMTDVMLYAFMMLVMVMMAMMIAHDEKCYKTQQNM